MNKEDITTGIFKVVFWTGFLSALIFILFCVIRWDFRFVWIGAACGLASLTAILAKIFYYND